MDNLFNEYFNIKKIIKEKRKYKQQLARIEAMPEEYQFVLKKIQSHMWMFTSGSGSDMIEVQNDLLELFESGITNGQNVLEITGDDVAAFCEELLRSCKTYTDDWRDQLNREILERVGNK